MERYSVSAAQTCDGAPMSLDVQNEKDLDALVVELSATNTKKELVEAIVALRKDGTTFTATHYLAANGTQYAPEESLDATIDAAIADEEE